MKAEQINADEQLKSQNLSLYRLLSGCISIVACIIVNGIIADRIVGCVYRVATIAHNPSEFTW